MRRRLIRTLAAGLLAVVLAGCIETIDTGEDHERLEPCSTDAGYICP